jgi:para-nitrobenzyl esterase
MADIEMALRWVQHNVEAFGGDPGNVTIFGQSGGSGKVVHLMHMPSAKGLFHRGIAQSSGSAGYLTVEESRRVAELTLKNLGLGAAQVSAIKTVPYFRLLEAANAALAQAQKELGASGRNLEWRPVSDGKYIEVEYSEFSRDMPFIVGTNFSERNNTFAIGDGRKNEWSGEETGVNLKQRYGANADGIVREFTRLFPDKAPADAFFYAPTYRTTVRGVLAKRIKESRAPVYNYLFAFEAPVNGGTTPFHCAELIYVFHNVGLPELRLATGDAPGAYRMQDVAARAWVNFAYTGNPSQTGIAWEPYTESGQGTMVFRHEQRVPEAR